MTDLPGLMNELLEKRTSVKRALDTATANHDYAVIAQHANSLAEIENQLGRLKGDLAGDYLDALEQEFVRVEAAERDAKLKFDQACREHDAEHARLMAEIPERLKSFQAACTQALEEKRRAVALANELRGKLSDARRSRAAHFAAHVR